MKSAQYSRVSPPIWARDYHVLNLLKCQVVEFLRRSAERVRHQPVVDLGAGEQPYRQLFEQAGCKYVACDIGTEDGADFLIDPHTQTTSLEAGYAKCVCSFQVLEHVLDVRSYLLEARRLLTDDGTLVLSTHGVWLYHPHPGDYHRWTRDGLIHEIEAAGFQVKSIHGIMGPLAWTTQFRTLGYFFVLERLGLVGRLIGYGVGLFMNARIFLEERITPVEIAQTNAAIYFVEATVKQ